MYGPERRKHMASKSYTAESKPVEDLNVILVLNRGSATDICFPDTHKYQ